MTVDLRPTPMAQPPLTSMTIEEYLAFDDGTDTRYELIDGELVKMPPESPLNVRISIFLVVQLAKWVPISHLCHKDAEIQLASIRPKFRYPDITVLSEAGAVALEAATRNTIFLDMPAPLLVVEVVSPDNPARDYRQKRSEYAVREIAEYWIVDPIQQQVTVLVLNEGFYDETQFRAEQPIQSMILPDLRLTAHQILTFQE